MNLFDQPFQVMFVVGRVRAQFFEAIPSAREHGDTIIHGDAANNWSERPYDDAAERVLGFKADRSYLPYTRLNSIFDSVLSFERNNETWRNLWIEYPEAYLHPDQQTRLVEEITRRADAGGFRVVMATNSPSIVCGAHFDQVLAVCTDDKGAVKTALLSEHPNVKSHEKAFGRLPDAGEFWTGAGEDWVLRLPQPSGEKT